MSAEGYSYGFKANAAAGWWPTAAGSCPIADLVAGNDLTLAGGVSLGYGTATLNGATGEATTVNPVLATDESFTVSAWVRPTSLSTFKAVLSQDGESESGFRLMYRPASYNAWCFVMPETDTPAPTLVKACAGSPPALGVWTHLVGVYDADVETISLYVDGSLIDSDSFTTPWSASGPFAVGRGQFSGTFGEHFAGDIADVRAWQQVLDPAGVVALAKLPPAAGRWGMDDPATAEAADMSGLDADHPATLTDGAAWASGHTGNALALDGTSGRAATVGRSSTRPWFSPSGKGRDSDRAQRGSPLARR